MGKGAFIKRMYDFSQKLQYKDYNEKKNKTQGEGGRVKDNEFSGVKWKTWNSSGIAHSVFH